MFLMQNRLLKKQKQRKNSRKKFRFRKKETLEKLSFEQEKYADLKNSSLCVEVRGQYTRWIKGESLLQFFTNIKN